MKKLTLMFLKVNIYLTIFIKNYLKINKDIRKDQIYHQINYILKI